MTAANPKSTLVRQRRRPPRKRGRPPADDMDQRARLLDAALECYAQHGIAATSGRSIAARAGVTPALVNYYFGSKEQLLAAVVAERVLPLMQELRQRVEAAGDDPRDLVPAFVGGLHAVVARHPWLPSLWVREILTEGGALRSLLFEQIAPAIAARMAERFREAQQRGTLSGTLDPRLLFVSLIGLTMFPLAARSIWGRVFDAADIDAAALERHTLGLLAHGIGDVDGR